MRLQFCKLSFILIDVHSADIHCGNFIKTRYFSYPSDKGKQDSILVKFWIPNIIFVNHFRIEHWPNVLICPDSDKVLMQIWTDLDKFTDSCLLTLVKSMTVGGHKLASLRCLLKISYHEAPLPGRTIGKTFKTILFIYQQRKVSNKLIFTKWLHVDLSPTVWSEEYQRAVG